MNEFLNLTMSGLVTGAIYSIMASGLVLTYTTSGIFNFAHGAIAFAVAYLYYQLHSGYGMPIVPALIISVFVFAPLLGLLLDRLNTLVFLQKHYENDWQRYYCRRIEQQAQDVMVLNPLRSPVSPRRPLAHLLGFILLLTVTLEFYKHFDPWSRLQSDEPAALAETVKPKPDLALPPENTAEQKRNWGEVRINEPGHDLRVTKVDAVPLLIEVASDQLLSNAKLAMHRGKRKQGGSICMYSREMDDSARKRRALARDLEYAAERGELLLNYQLQMSLNDGKICGAEALMRWKHPKLGMVSPAEFIPLAEETEAIFEMGEWALRAACRDAAEGKIPGNVAVNLSPVQFGREDLAEMIHGILLETGLPPARLEVEVTESTIMSDQSRGLHILRKLKAMGITVAMDDFGTGYSSLATLHAFPFDKIKLDQSFVKRLPHDAAAAAIVRTVLAHGESLRMPVLAEGIETEAQWDFLAHAGCAKGQGYLFARPAAVAQLSTAISAAARSARDAVPAVGAAHATVAA